MLCESIIDGFAFYVCFVFILNSAESEMKRENGRQASHYAKNLFTLAEKCFAMKCISLENHRSASGRFDATTAAMAAPSQDKHTA